MRNRVWWHLGVLVLAAAVLSLGSAVSSGLGRAYQPGWGPALHAALLGLPGDLYRILPLLAGIAVGTADAGRRGVRVALGVLAVVLLAMVAIDTVIDPAADDARVAAARANPARWAPSDTMVAVSPLQGKGALRTLASLAGSGFAGVGERASYSYPAQHPRVRAYSAMAMAGLLLLPFVTMGLVLGAGAWLRTRVTFRMPRDEVVARWVLAWLLAPAAMAVIGVWTESTSYRALWRGLPLWNQLLGYVPLMLVAWLGWRAARRAPEVAQVSAVTTSPTTGA